MVRRDRESELAFVPFLVVNARERDVGRVRLPVGGELAVAAGDEEPQLVLQEKAAERRLVDRVDLVVAARGLRGLGRPLVAGERVAEGRVELVAARLRQGVDDAAGETAVLGRDRRRLGRRFLDRVLDVEGVRGVADVVLDHDAVDHVQVLVRHGARDREVAGGSGGRHARGQDGGAGDAAGDRQGVDQALVIGRRDLLPRRDVVVGPGDGDLLGNLRGRHRRVQRRGLRGVDLDGRVERLEPHQLEPDVVVAGGQEGEEVRAGHFGHGGTRALQVRRGHGDGHARERVFPVVGAPGQRPGRVLRERGQRNGEQHCGHEHESGELHLHVLLRYAICGTLRNCDPQHSTSNRFPSRFLRVFEILRPTSFHVLLNFTNFTSFVLTTCERPPHARTPKPAGGRHIIRQRRCSNVSVSNRISRMRRRRFHARATLATKSSRDKRSYVQYCIVLEMRLDCEKFPQRSDDGRRLFQRHEVAAFRHNDEPRPRNARRKKPRT